MRNKFALTGAAGYVAPRHMRAIKDTGNELVAVLDPHDSVGILDSYFPRARYFSEPERFDRHLEKLRRKGSESRIHWMSVCSPNYLHDAHIRMALRLGANVVCEKPVVLNPWNIDAIAELEEETGKKVFCLLQLRNHPSVKKLKDKVSSYPDSHFRDEVEITYIAPRGAWYKNSWKGNLERSGGLVSNIGVHFFDMLLWIYGKVKNTDVLLSGPGRSAGSLELEKASVKWFLSISGEDLANTGHKSLGTYRSIRVNGEEIQFSDGLKDLHTVTYCEILGDGGTRVSECRQTVQLLHDIRNSVPVHGDEMLMKSFFPGRSK